jgi:hypothetical protein
MEAFFDEASATRSVCGGIRVFFVESSSVGKIEFSSGTFSGGGIGVFPDEDSLDVGILGEF